MKVCKYCESENIDETLNCSKCGANEFRNKCNNCNTVFDTTFCPNCGKRAGEKPKKCPDCGNMCFDLFCPKCGTDLTNIAQNSNMDGMFSNMDTLGEDINEMVNTIINNTKNSTYSSTTRTFTKKSGNSVTNTVINTVTNEDINTDSMPNRVPPEVIMQNYNAEIKSKKTARVIKGVVLSVFVIIFLVILVSCMISLSQYGHDLTEEAAQSTSTKIEIDKYANVDGMDIVKKEGHPLFYGNYKEAEKFWKDYSKVKVSNISDIDALLCITSHDEDNGIITDINFNFSDVKDRDKLKVEDLLKVVCKYIPYDIIDKYYSYKTSYKETQVDTNIDFVAYRYIMTLNNNGKKLKNPNYNETFAFDIICRQGNDWIAQINPFAALGNYQKIKTEKYKIENWKVDINKYRPKTDTTKVSTAKPSVAKADTNKANQNKKVSGK